VTPWIIFRHCPCVCYVNAVDVVELIIIRCLVFFAAIGSVSLHLIGWVSDTPKDTP